MDCSTTIAKDIVVGGTVYFKISSDHVDYDKEKALQSYTVLEISGNYVLLEGVAKPVAKMSLTSTPCPLMTCGNCKYTMRKIS